MQMDFKRQRLKSLHQMMYNWTKKNFFKTLESNEDDQDIFINCWNKDKFYNLLGLLFLYSIKI